MASRARALARLARPLFGRLTVAGVTAPSTSAVAAPLLTPLSSQLLVPRTSVARTFASIVYPPATAEVGEPAPEWTTSAVVDGEIKPVSLKEYRGKWVVLFWYPKDWTFVCPTEICDFSDRAPEFAALNCAVIAASTDTPESHLNWIRTPRKRGGLGHMQIPVLADVTKSIAAQYGVLKASAGIALRGLYLIDPQGVIQHITINNFPVGRNVDEALRLLQAFQYTAEHGEVCPAGWTPGARTMKPGDASAEYFAGVEEEADFTARLKLLATPAEFAQATAGPGPVLVDFYASWCGKCRQIAPLVDELQEKHKSVKFFKVDTDAEAMRDLVKSLGITALPEFRLYKGGKEVSKITGYKRTPLSDAVAKIA